MTSTFIPRSRIIRDVWRAVFGDDPIVGRVTGDEQYRVLCPFHAEREPSCDVSIGKNVFVCRSCGASGGVLDIVIRAGEATTRSEAINWLENHGVRPC